jgi:flagellar basal-body rod protein FlgG
MIRALYSAASGMTAQQLNVDNIAHNLANANTAGFKTRRAQFQDLMYQNLIQPGAAASQQSSVPTGLQLGLGTRASSNEIIFSQGDFSATSNPLDVVIQGRGFFQILKPTGQLGYTRGGSFQLNKEGALVTSDGNLLQPQITIPNNAQSITIAKDGTVSYTLPNQTTAQHAGQIQLANFQNPAGLNSEGSNLYTPTDASGDPIIGQPGGQEGLGSRLQGYLEQSNVSVVDEFVNLIVSQRAYEANSKVVKAADEMYQQVNNINNGQG